MSHLYSTDDWSPTSWQSKTAEQQPAYPDAAAVEHVMAQISKLPPLVTSMEIESLKQQLGEASKGNCFLLQGGDCAESFDDCESGPIAAKLKILLQMSLVLVHATRKPVIRVGRIAGQYAKPRSSDQESRGEVSLPSYRGDLVNRSGFTSEERVPDPHLLLRGYTRAALTMNFLRALADSGFADLHHPEYWKLNFAKNSELERDYEGIVESIRGAVDFMEAISGFRLSNTRRVDLYTSHEGLALLYEQAQTRQVPRRDGWYNLSTHLPWVGMRTAKLEGAHIEYFRGIQNPIAVKVGPGMSAEGMRTLIDTLHPFDEPGRLTLIHRLGAGQVESKLPPLLEAVRATGKTVLWVCDPMHGNTETTKSGIKTRRFDKILQEVETSFDVHRAHGSVLGGVHFEMTGEDVTECIGGSSGLDESDLTRDYRSRVDPRLNYDQALELAMRMAQHLARFRD